MHFHISTAPKTFEFLRIYPLVNFPPTRAKKSPAALAASQSSPIFVPPILRTARARNDHNSARHISSTVFTITNGTMPYADPRNSSPPDFFGQSASNERAKHGVQKMQKVEKGKKSPTSGQRTTDHGPRTTSALPPHSSPLTLHAIGLSTAPVVSSFEAFCTRITEQEEAHVDDRIFLH